MGDVAQRRGKLLKSNKASPPTLIEDKIGDSVFVGSREPPIIRTLSQSLLYGKQKNTPVLGVFFVGAEKRILAFSGAPRWTIINCPGCLMKKA